MNIMEKIQFTNASKAWSYRVSEASHFTEQASTYLTRGDPGE